MHLSLKDSFSEATLSFQYVLKSCNLQFSIDVCSSAIFISHLCLLQIVILKSNILHSIFLVFLDQIAVLDQGQIVEVGNYDELISKKDGTFYNLIKHQAFSS